MRKKNDKQFQALAPQLALKGCRSIAGHKYGDLLSFRKCFQQGIGNASD
jgi:hypothetical protein